MYQFQLLNHRHWHFNQPNYICCTPYTPTMTDWDQFQLLLRPCMSSHNSTFIAWPLFCSLCVAPSSVFLSKSLIALPHIRKSRWMAFRLLSVSHCLWMAKDYGSHGRYACSDDEWQIGIRGRRYEFMSLIQSISKPLFRLAPLLSAVGRKVV